MLYTRRGDDGTSGLFGTKQRYAKDSPIYQALGTVDELNSLLGICRAKSASYVDISKAVMQVQEALFIIQAELAGTDKRIAQAHIHMLEQCIAGFEERITNPHAFVIPGATETSALFDYARAVSRRAERDVLTARSTHAIGNETLAYLNRVSSLLYVIARKLAQEGTREENSPTYK